MLLDGDVMVDYIGEVCYYRKFINGIGEINPGKYELTEHGKTLFQDCDWSRYVI